MKLYWNTVLSFSIIFTENKTIFTKEKNVTFGNNSKENQ